MTAALFDLDHTLLTSDSNTAWCEVLVRHGLLEMETVTRATDDFARDYHQGVLDYAQYIAFLLDPVRGLEPGSVGGLIDEFTETAIRPLVTQSAMTLVRRHRSTGHRLVLVTATVDVLARPIAQMFGMDLCVATRTASDATRIDTSLVSTPCYREGKLENMLEVAAANGIDLATAWFYSDSSNDLPLLENVGHPVPTNPDPDLKRIADSRGWPVVLTY